MPLSRRSILLLLLGLSLLLFLFRLGARDIVTSHEARVAQTARQMAQTWPWQGRTLDVPEVAMKDIGNGVMRLAPTEGGRTIRVNPWIVPVMSDRIRLQKPPLPYWCAAILFRLFGFSAGAARLIPALLSAASVLLVYDLARLLIGRRAGWVAGLVWISTYLLLDEGRKAMADPYLAFFTLVCIWAWIRGSARSAIADPISLVFIFYLSLALGMLAKGPLVLLHVAIPLLLFHFCFPRRPRGGWGSHLLGIGLFLIVAAPWYLYVMLRVPHAMDIWRYESVGELTANNTENARAWWFYFPNLLLIAVPWTALWAMGLALPAARWKMRRDQPARLDRRPWFALLWLLIIVVFFSLVQQKKNAYLLPIMAAQTLLVTQAVVMLIAWSRGSRPRREARTWMVGHAIVGIVLAGVVGVLLARTPSSGRAIGFVVCAVGLLLGIGALWKALLQHSVRWAVLQPITFGVLIAAFLGFYIAPRENRRSARPVALEAQRLLQQPGYTLATRRLQEEAAVYLPLDVPYAPKHHVLVIVNDSTGAESRSKRHLPYHPPAPRSLQNWIDDGRVIDVHRIPVPGAPGDARWKLYDLTVDRRVIVLAGQTILDP